jgi:glycosyltransferase involved in cell wall biosynthesis
MKVLFFAPVPPPLNGATYMIKTLLESELKEHYDVTHINCSFVEHFNDPEGSLTFRKGFLFVTYLIELVRCLFIVKPAVVVICPNFSRNSFIKTSIYIFICARLFRKKTILWCHANGLGKLYNGSFFLLRLMIRYIMRVATCIVTPSSKIAEENSNFFVDVDKLCTIHYGIPSELVQSSHDDRKTIKVVYISNMFIAKGWRILFAAATVICRKCYDVTFNFYGSPTFDSPREDIDKLFNSSSSSERIRYHGPVYELAKEKVLAESSIFCFPTYFEEETFGIVNIEAMKYGLPIIATNHDGIPEIVDDNLGGFLVEKRNTNDLVDKLEILISNENLRLSMGLYNRMMFAKKFTVDKFVENWIVLLNRFENN